MGIINTIRQYLSGKENFLNKKCYLSIGEPWNFEGPDGKNSIKGAIVKIISPRCLVFKANNVTNFKGTGSFLALFPRYVGTSFDDLKTGINIDVNGILIEDYQDDMNEKELEKRKICNNWQY